MISIRLSTYLNLEQQMLKLDDTGDPLADILRDAMDPIWFSLTDEEHKLLDNRSINEVSDACIAVPAGEQFFTNPGAKTILVPRDPLQCNDWKDAA